MTIQKAVTATPLYADGGPQHLSTKLPGSDDKTIGATRRARQALSFEKIEPYDSWVSLGNAAVRALLNRRSVQ